MECVLYLGLARIPSLTSGLPYYFGLAWTTLDCSWLWLLPLDLPSSPCLAPSSAQSCHSWTALSLMEVLNLMAVGIVRGAKGELTLLPVNILKAVANRSQ